MPELDMFRVLLADDDPDFRSWLKSLLNSSKDFEVVGEASNGTEAMDLVSSLTPDLVITDLYMPDPDGVSITRHINRNFPGTKAILVSAHEGRTYVELANNEGALAFIPKRKVSLEVLRAALQ